MDTYAQSPATAGGEPAAPVHLDAPRVVQAETDYAALAEQSRQQALAHSQRLARQEGNAVS